MARTNYQQSKLEPISICFADHHISELFSSLLQTMGVPTQEVRQIDQLAGSCKIITEPQFFPELTDENKNQCLLIGSAEALEGIDALSISQPLTESKIEWGLTLFLEGREH